MIRIRIDNKVSFPMKIMKILVVHFASPKIPQPIGYHLVVSYAKLVTSDFISNQLVSRGVKFGCSAVAFDHPSRVACGYCLHVSQCSSV